MYLIAKQVLGVLANLPQHFQYQILERLRGLLPRAAGEGRVETSSPLPHQVLLILDILEGRLENVELLLQARCIANFLCSSLMQFFCSLD